MLKKGQDPMKDITVDDAIDALEYYAKGIGKVFGVPTPYFTQVSNGMRNGEPWSLIYSSYVLNQGDEKISIPDAQKPFVLDVYAMQMFNKSWSELNSSQKNQLYDRYPYLK